MIKKLNRGAYTLFTPMRYLIAAVQGKMQGTVQGIARTATRASHGLRVKTAIGRISVLNAAVLVQRPVPHCGVGPIVRKPKHNGVARTAVGAVDIGVPVAPVGRIKKFFQASIANSKVGRATWSQSLPGKSQLLPRRSGPIPRACWRGPNDTRTDESQHLAPPRELE